MWKEAQSHQQALKQGMRVEPASDSSTSYTLTFTLHCSCLLRLGCNKPRSSQKQDRLEYIAPQPCLNGASTAVTVKAVDALQPQVFEANSKLDGRLRKAKIRTCSAFHGMYQRDKPRTSARI